MLSPLLVCALCQEPVRPDVPAPKVVELATDEVIVPMTHTGGHAIVQVTVDGHGPYPFVVDTCAMGHGRIDAALANELGLTSAGSVRAADGTLKNTRTAELYEVAALDVGQVHFGGVMLVATPGQGRSERGVLGFGLFRELLLTIDYPRNRLVVREDSLSRDLPHVTELIGDANIARVAITFGETTMEARLDTGNQGCFTVAPDVLTKFKTQGEPHVVGKGRSLNNEFEIRATKMAEPLGIADLELDGLDVHVVEIFRGANLGYAVLKAFALTFDQSHRLVQFAKP